tara:strand:- start:724 stop:2313 length:1590 start_codon:yes stop_codon:yes gene_type:complete
MEEMKENRALYKEMAKTRYTVDLATYEAEAKKVRQIESALADIKNGNGGQGLGKYDAALRLIQANPDEMAFLNSLADKDKTAYVVQKTNTFEDILNDNNEVTGFKVNYSKPNLNTPQLQNYFKGSDFWNKYAEEIQDNTSGPLTKQVKKLLGKDKDVESVVAKDLDIQGTKIIEDFGNKETISGNTNEDDLFLQGQGGTFAYSWTSKTDEGWQEYSFVYDNYKDIKTDNSKASKVAAPILALDSDSLKNLTTTEDGQVKADGDAQFLLGQTTNLYNASNTFLYDSIVYADSAYPNLKANTRASSTENHNKIFTSQWNARTITLSNESKVPFAGGTIDGKYVIGTDIVPIMVGKDLSPIFYNEEAKAYIETKVNAFIKDKSGSLQDLDSQIKGVIRQAVIEIEEQIEVNKANYNEQGQEIKTEGSDETTDDQSITSDYIINMAKENNLSTQEVIKDLESNNVIVPNNVKESLIKSADVPEKINFTDGQAFTKLEDVLKVIPESMTGQEIIDKYNINFPINKLSLFTPIKE